MIRLAGYDKCTLGVPEYSHPILGAVSVDVEDKLL